MSDLTLRSAIPSVALCLGVLALQVFLDTYAPNGIRPALARDALQSCGVARYDAFLADPDVTILVAEAAGHLVGFAQLAHAATHPLRPGEAGAELVRLYVQEPFTARGIGRDLLRQAEKAAAARGAEQLWLTAWALNARALWFYPRCGYEDIGRSDYVFEDEVHENRVFAKRIRHVAPA
jgi:diamine N-acetyltransferase